MEIIKKPLEELIPYAKNPRKNDEAVAAVANSIRNFGFRVPIIIDANSVIVAGHTRLKAAMQLGLEEVPCIMAGDLTPEQVNAFRLADNKVSEKATWDDELLTEELRKLGSLDMEQFGFRELREEADWFSERVKNDDSRQEGNEEYNAFLDKFEIEKTTDDCYTPDIVYDAVAGWVEKRYKIDRKKFVRPFYPGGDYEHATYEKNCLVVDNPPFSILSKIVRFYIDNGIRFFLFAPTVSMLNSSARMATAVCIGASITYENKAAVNTSFVTNMEPGVAAMCDSELYRVVQAAADEYASGLTVSLPKYVYPDCVCTGSMLSKYAKYGQDLAIRSEDCMSISALDAQRDLGKAIYGGGLLLSEKAAAEKAAAEKAAAEKAAAEKAAAEKAEVMVWELTERERELQRSLGKKAKTD